MQEEITSELSDEFLSSARVFAWSAREVIERTVLRKVAGNKLSIEQLKLLYLVAHTDVVNSSQGAAFLRVSAAAGSKAVDKLQGEIYLREPCHFRESCQRNCFFQRHQAEEQGRPLTRADVLSKGRGNNAELR